MVDPRWFTSSVLQLDYWVAAVLPARLSLFSPLDKAVQYRDDHAILDRFVKGGKERKTRRQNSGDPVVELENR